MTNPGDGSAGNRFAAQMLERGASGYAGFTSSAMMEAQPELVGRYQPDAFGTWKAFLTQRILELAAAVGTGQPQLFASRVLWSRKALLAREQPVEDLALCLRTLRETLGDNLPAAAAGDPLQAIDQALESLSASDGDDVSELDPDDRFDRLALRYLQRVLEGDVAEAIAEVLAATGEEISHLEAYQRVLMPAQREVGRLWHLGEMNVAEEHLVTHATQRAMAALVQSRPPEAANGKTLIAASVPGNAHDIGLRAVADVFQLAGWRTVYLGADVPAPDLAAAMTFFDSDLLVLTATLSTQLAGATRTIEAIRERAERPVAILVGGSAFDEAPDVYKTVGADGYAATIDEALRVGQALVESGN